MKSVVLVLPLVLVLTGAASPDRFGEICSGSETVTVGSQPPRTLPYDLSFSADLAAGRYCYDKCGPAQSFAIANAHAAPIRLADLDDGPRQSRHLVFDRAAQALTDDQSLDAGLAIVKRHARAQCHAALFTAPTP